MFNGVIWPDFTRLPDGRAAGAGAAAVEVGQVAPLGAAPVEVLPPAHRAGRGLRRAATRDGGAWVFTGDTGPNPALWQRLASAAGGRWSSRPPSATTRRTGPHQPPPVPGSCGELAQLRQPTEVYITHIKPGELEAVMPRRLEPATGAANRPARRPSTWPSWRRATWASSRSRRQVRPAACRQMHRARPFSWCPWKRTALRSRPIRRVRLLAASSAAPALPAPCPPSICRVPASKPLVTWTRLAASAASFSL
jgi:hypothetical protein